jgi:chloramphenicol 3-O-phosphotransferase
MKGNIIFLNGVSSAGKSTLSKEIVKLLPNYFHFSVDDYDTIIERMEEELERRELARGDRRIGQARLQLQFVHQQKEAYDIEVDTFNNGTKASAKAIAEFVLANEASLGFSK